MGILYRKAAPKDAAALLDFLNAVGRESDNLSFGAEGLSITVEQEEKILENLENSPVNQMLLAFDGGELVGNASINASSRPRFAHRRSIAISVRKDWWGRGIGSGLMERLIAFAKETGAEVISLEVRSDNARAIALYEKFGFKRFGTYERFFKFGDEYFDADYMNLYL